MSGFLVPSVLFLIQTDNSEVPVGIVQTLTSCQLFQDLSKNITIIIETMRIYFQQVHSFELNPSFLLVNNKCRHMMRTAIEQCLTHLKPFMCVVYLTFLTFLSFFKGALLLVSTSNGWVLAPPSRRLPRPPRRPRPRRRRRPPRPRRRRKRRRPRSRRSRKSHSRRKKRRTTRSWVITELLGEKTNSYSINTWYWMNCNDLSTY